jgi:hypothetical protein
VLRAPQKARPVMVTMAEFFREVIVSVTGS